MTETAAPAKKAPKSLKDCACRSFEVGEEFETGGQPDRSIFTTECDRSTHSVFAQGHDAKLVGFLVRAHLDGQTLWRNAGGMLVTFSGPVEAARTISEALAVKAEKMLATAKRKADERAARLADKEAKKTAKTNQPTATETTAPVPAETKSAPRRRRAKTA